MMRRSSEILLKDAIEKFLRDFKLEDKLNETRLVSHWEKVAGKLIARHTLDLYVRERVLYVRTDTPALKQELTYMKTRLIQRLNKLTGKEVIEDIRFL